MKNNEKGVTLIALVITIIVLLILAGISISLIAGDNGVLQKAKNAKVATERTSVIEYAQAEIVGKQTENESNQISKNDLLAVLDNYFSNVEDIKDSENILEEKVKTKSKYGVYEIKVSEIYNNGFAEEKFSYVVEEANNGINILSKGVRTSASNVGVMNLETIECHVGEKVTVSLAPNSEMRIFRKGESYVYAPNNYMIAESGAVRVDNDSVIRNGRFYLAQNGSATLTSRADITSRYDVSGSDSSSTSGTISGTGTSEGTVDTAPCKFECIAAKAGTVNVELDCYAYDGEGLTYASGDSAKDISYTLKFTINIVE